MDSQLRDPGDAVLAMMNERELAELRHRNGAQVIQHGGRYWERIGAAGFYQPVNLLAPLDMGKVSRPTFLSWGYRAALAEGSAGAANGMLPIVRLADLPGYDVGRLTSNRRNKLRKCWKSVEIFQLTGPRLLLEQGYELVLDAVSRTRHERRPVREEYLAEAVRHFEGGQRCVLVGLIDGRLGGYLDGYAVDGIAYGVSAYYATWALPTNISTGLIYEFAQICRRTAGIRWLIGGMDAREDPQLARFKEDMGFVVDRIPIKWSMNMLIRALIRWRRPHAYYRLTGRD